MLNRNYIIPIFVSHLGCPHTCVFCNQKEITGEISQPTGQTVTKKIQEYLETIPAGSYVEVAFYGGSFTAIDQLQQKELLSPAYDAFNKGLIQGIRLSTRPDYINEDILSLLAAFGVSIIELGVQSTNEEVLTKSRRGHTGIDVIKSAKLIKDWGFSLGLQMMIGLPGDNPEKAFQTAQDLISLHPDFVRIYPTLVVKNTQLAKLYREGIYNPLTLPQAIEICKDLLLLFNHNNIKVIRIGLQPTDEINEGAEVIAGPFHPAFRELVEAAIAREQLLYLLNKHNGPHKSISISINPADTSIVRGQKNINIAFLKATYQVERIEIIPKDYIERGTIVLLENNNSIVCTRNDLVI